MFAQNRIEATSSIIIEDLTHKIDEEEKTEQKLNDLFRLNVYQSLRAMTVLEMKW